MDCVFCKIINNELPAYKVYEDDFVLAFLDINPAALGHTLVIPKKHFENIFDIDETYFQKIFATAKRIVQKMTTEGICEGVNLYQANGKAAEQTVPHFHLHLIPRRPNDGIDFTGRGFNIISKPTEEEFEAIRQKLNLLK
ncbi:MAG TPA: HIT family protein [Candidatus Paceibacterota bacterium]|nr:HIT family protein [Candidatus Paceibacterota bacterium]